MNIKISVACLAAAVLVAGCETGEHENEHESNHADIKAQAKVTEAEARATALTKAPDATIKEAELEKEHGKLIWSFDISKPNAEGIGEINVDAITGEIVSVEK